MEPLQKHIESLIFASEDPITTKEMKAVLEEVLGTPFKKNEVEDALAQLREVYAQEDRSLEIVEIAGGFQMLTKPAFHHTVGTYLKLTTRKRLSRAALETLAIVAYKQPVPKSELEKIRGVNCDYALQKLLEKELVSIVGRSEGPGRPLLYGTSQKFMDYFGLKGLEDLPRPRDFKGPDQEIGEKAPIEETGEVLPQEQKKEEESDD